MNIFELAIIQVKKEGKINNKNAMKLIIDRAYAIRKWLDLSDKNKQVAENRK